MCWLKYWSHENIPQTKIIFYFSRNGHQNGHLDVILISYLANEKVGYYKNDQWEGKKLVQFSHLPSWWSLPHSSGYFMSSLIRCKDLGRRPLTSWEWPEFTNERTDSSVLANQQQGHVSLCDSVLKMLKGCWLVILFQRSRDIKITLLLMVTRTISLESVKYF